VAKCQGGNTFGLVQDSRVASAARIPRELPYSDCYAERKV
jgi:hypothetical protein